MLVPHPMNSRSDSATTKSAISTKKTTCEVTVHFNKEKHQFSDFEFIVIEQICNNDDKHNVDKRLLTREAFWCSQLCTLQTYGLNKRSEFNSKNRIEYNWHISPFELHILLLFNYFFNCKFLRGRPFNSWGMGGGGDVEKKFPATAFRKKKIACSTNVILL